MHNCKNILFRLLFISVLCIMACFGSSINTGAEEFNVITTSSMSNDHYQSHVKATPLDNTIDIQFLFIEKIDTDTDVDSYSDDFILSYNFLKSLLQYLHSLLAHAFSIKDVYTPHDFFVLPTYKLFLAIANIRI